jgi:hypothetical protein
MHRSAEVAKIEADLLALGSHCGHIADKIDTVAVFWQGVSPTFRLSSSTEIDLP